MNGIKRLGTSILLHVTLIIWFMMINLCGLAQSLSFTDSLRHELDSQPGNREIIRKIMNHYAFEDLDSFKIYHDLALKYINSSDAAERLNLLLYKIETLQRFNQFDSASILIESIANKDVTDPGLSVRIAIAEARDAKSRQALDEALNILYQVADQIEENELQHYLPDVYLEIGYILSRNNDLKNSTRYLHLGLANAQEFDNHEVQVDICYELCRIYNGGIIVNLDSSIFYGEMGMQIAKENDLARDYVIMMQIATAPIIRKGDYIKGLNMSKEVLKYYDHVEVPIINRYYTLLNLGFVCEILEKYDSALLYMDAAQKLRPAGVDHHRLNYLILKSKREYEEALKAFETYQTKRDSIMKLRNESKLSSLQARLEANMKEQEVDKLTQTAALQSLQLSQQRYLFLGLLLLFALSILAAVLLYRQRQLKQQQMVTSLELEETKKRLEIEKLYRC
jgi:hypothetical protein